MAPLNLDFIKSKFEQKSNEEIISILSNNRDDYDQAIMPLLENILLSRGDTISNLEKYKSNYHALKASSITTNIIMEPATFLYRFLQYITDVILFFGLCYLMQFFVKFSEKGEYEMYAILVYIAYFSLSEGFLGRTPGMMILNLRVIKVSNLKPIDFGDGLLRSICRLLNVILLQLGYLLMLFDKNKQALHDKLSKTLVIFDDRGQK